MIGRTHTKLWRNHRQLHAFMDIVLPFPIGITQAIVAGVSFAIWLSVWNAVGLQRAMAVFGDVSGGMGVMFVVLPPLLAGWAVGQQIVEGRTVMEYVWAAVRWTMLPRQLYRQDVPRRLPATVHATAEVWTPDRSH